MGTRFEHGNDADVEQKPCHLGQGAEPGNHVFDAVLKQGRLLFHEDGDPGRASVLDDNRQKGDV
jgi:hypothetical protein